MSRTSNSNSSSTTYRCTECGETSASLGRLHAHAEKHRGLFGLQWPWNVGNYEALMEMTEVVHG